MPKSTHYPLITTHWRSRPGITILEILIVLVLLAITSLFVYALFSAQIRLFLTQVLRIDVSSQNKIALTDITNQTRQAESISASCPNPPCAAGEATTDTDSVVYRLPGLDASGNPTTSYYDYLVYKQVGTSLKRTIYTDASSTRVASDDIITTNLAPIGGITFAYNNASPAQANQITTTVTTTKTESGGKAQTISQSSRAKIRNQGADPLAAGTSVIGQGKNPSVIKGGDGLPLIVYDEDNTPALKAVKCSNNACSGTNQVTSITTLSSTDNNVVLSNDNLPIVAYAKSDIIYVVRCLNNECTSKENANAINAADPNAGASFDMAIGSDGFPIISYDKYDGFFHSLKMAKCGDIKCSSGNSDTLLDSLAGQDIGANSSITKNSDGYPIIVYEGYASGNNSVRIMRCTNANCTAHDPTIDMILRDLFGHSSILMGTDNLPIIAATTPYIETIHCGNSACTSSNTTTNHATDNDDLDAAIGSDGKPIIAYVERSGSQQTLKIIACTTQNCSALQTPAKTLDTSLGSTQGSISPPSIAIGSDNFPIVVYSKEEPDNVYNIYAYHCTSFNCQ